MEGFFFFFLYFNLTMKIHFKTDLEVRRHTFTPLTCVLKYLDILLILATLSSGSLHKEKEEESIFSLPGCPHLASNPIPLLTLELNSSGFQHIV